MLTDGTAGAAGRIIWLASVTDNMTAQLAPSYAPIAAKCECVCVGVHVCVEKKYAPVHTLKKKKF